jgi:hypothetical protein
MKAIRVGAVAAAVATATTLVLNVPPASASTLYGYSTWTNQATGRCLDDSTAYGNDVLRAFSCNGKDYQIWYSENLGGILGAIRLWNKATGRCLDDSTAYGHDVLRAIDCNGKDYQVWFATSGDPRTLENAATGRYLDDSTAYGNDVLRALDWNGQSYQNWL